MAYEDLDLDSALVKLKKLTEAIKQHEKELDPRSLLENVTYDLGDYLMSDLKETWFQCMWNGIDYSECNPSMFKRLFTVHGSCLLFNPPSPTNHFVETVEGSLGGLTAIFDIKLNESSGKSHQYEDLLLSSNK